MPGIIGPMSGEDFPRKYARTGRLGFGVPRDFTISPDGERVVFIRSGGGRDPIGRLRVFDLAGGGGDRLAADPAALLGGTADHLDDAERVRRERSRERAGGIVSYAADRAVTRAVFTLSGRLWLASLTGAAAAPVREIAASGTVGGPRLDPAGEWIAYTCAGGLRVVRVDGTDERVLAAPEGPDVTYGVAEHVAAEEMNRTRGFWWAPDGGRLLVTRVDTAQVQRLYLADPASPQASPREIAYPLAGTHNADVSLWIIRLDGSRTEVHWDRCGFEYLVRVSWDHRPVLVVQARDQRTVRILAADPVTGATSVLREEHDDAWVDVAPGVPATTGSGALVWIAAAQDTYRLLLDGQPVTPPGLQIREVLGTDGDTVLMTASSEPTQIDLWAYAPRPGLARLTTGPGVHHGQRAGGVTVVVSQSLDRDGTQITVHRGGERVGEIASLGEQAGIPVRAGLFRAGGRQLRTAVQLPSWHEPGAGPLPVLLDPYGGPGFQRVLSASRGFGLSQWFADQGFAVVIADGRGTPGRGPAWERTIRGDIAGPVLDDQIAALRAAAARYPDLDLGRVAIRGWSFGGFLAALAVLRRPDVFHAAIAGAALADQRLYDTYWKERFLGLPGEEPENYDRCSLLTYAAGLRRPLMLIQGLADDNALAANTLRLSAALLAAGRPHTVLPLPGTTHMVTDENVFANMLHLQVDFLRRSLGIALDGFPQVS
jgi:dipeptidyl-peptidase 4